MQVVALCVLAAVAIILALSCVGAWSLTKRLRMELSRCATALENTRVEYAETRAGYATLIEETHIRRKPSKETYREVSGLYDEPDMMCHDLPMERAAEEDRVVYRWQTLSAADVVALYDNGFYTKK